MELTSAEIKDVNTRYHDIAATSYDAKWGIDFDQVGKDQALKKLAKTLGRAPTTFDNCLEIGAGTGFLSLNLATQGLIQDLTATDISPGMLKVFEQNAKELGIAAKTVACEAEKLPFEDSSFDLVLGHAILHHIPDLDKAFSEFARVLKPGGQVAFCGDPSSTGDRIAALPKRAGTLLGPLWRRAVRASKRSQASANGSGKKVEAELEGKVDVHAFDPAVLRSAAEQAGLIDVRVNGEELLANIFGWLARTLEAGADTETIPDRWRYFAFNTYINLQKVDEALLEKRLPAAIFYNLMISARKK